MKILIAPSAFKGTLAASDAAEALAAGAAEALPGAEIVPLPIADGGDGTMQVLVHALDGEVVSMSAMGPLGRPVDAGFGWLPGDVAVVELASASGLSLVAPQDRDPLRSTTRGTGDLIATALERKPRRVMVGAGGSASNDGGSGIADALGVTLFDATGSGIGPGALGLMTLERIEVSRRDPNLEGLELIVACDVANPLLGPAGAARVFAPQKGASSAEVEDIEKALTKFADVIERDVGISLDAMPRAGAAGGAAGGMHALLGAELHDGFEVIAELLGFDRLLETADLLIVGEGRLDDQSLSGKATIAAARRAKARGIPVWVFAGKVVLAPAALEGEGIGMVCDLSERVGKTRALSDPGPALRRLSAELLRQAFG